jgi:hypothetical protein
MKRRPGLFKRQRERLRRDAIQQRIEAWAHRWRADRALRRSAMVGKRNDSRRLLPAHGNVAA